MASSETLTQWILRFGLAATAMVNWHVANVLGAGGDPIRETTTMVLIMIHFALSLVFFVLAVQGRSSSRLSWVILPTLLLVMLSHTHVISVGKSQLGSTVGGTDVLVFSQYSAELAKLGENPYTQDMIESYRVYRQSMLFGTPLLNADLTTRAPYPALSFLLFLPFGIVGITGTYVYTVFLALSLVVIFAGTAPEMRPLILLPFFADLSFINYSMGGVSDIVWAFFMCMVVYVWDRRWLAAVFFGLACAFKQTPWLFAPFLLLRVWMDMPIEGRWRSVLTFSGVSAGVFLAINAPYIVWDFRAWWAGMMEPFGANMIYYGQGLTSLTVYGYGSIPRAGYVLLMAAVYGGALILYWRDPVRWREFMWLFPAVALWFGHRSLNSYWYFHALPFFFGLAQSPEWLARKLDQPKTMRWSLPPVVLGCTVALLLGGITWPDVRPTQLTVEVEPPFATSGDLVSRLRVSVTNTSDVVVRPRFSVQSWAYQPFFWVINAGPQELKPGQTARYQISSDVPYEAFNLRQGAQVIVSDMDDYDLRGSIVLEGEINARYVDGIPNSDYLYWHGDGSSVYFWGTITAPPQPREPVVRVSGDRPAIQLNLTTTRKVGWSYVMLDTWINFPESPLEVWVYPPANANDISALTVAYGMEFVSTRNRNRVWVLFGDEASYGQLEPGLHYWMIPAPRETWSRQIVDLRTIFDTLDLAISPPERILRFNQEYPTSMLNLRWLLAAQPQAPLPLKATFGSVNTTMLEPDPTQMVRDILAHPESTLIWRGKMNYSARNYERALEYYMRALAVAPDNGHVQFGVAQANFWLKNFDVAITHYQLSIALGHRVANSYKGIGWSYHGQRRMDEAIRMFWTALDHNPRLADAYNGLGHTYIRLEDCDQAVAMFEQALALNRAARGANNGLQLCGVGE